MSERTRMKKPLMISPSSELTLVCGLMRCQEKTSLSFFLSLPQQVFKCLLYVKWASLMAQTVKNLPAMQETLVQSVGWEDPLERIATRSSTLAWRIPWTEEPGRLQFMGLQRFGQD